MNKEKWLEIISGIDNLLNEDDDKKLIRKIVGKQKEIFTSLNASAAKEHLAIIDMIIYGKNIILKQAYTFTTSLKAIKATREKKHT